MKIREKILIRIENVAVSNRKITKDQTCRDPSIQ